MIDLSRVRVTGPLAPFAAGFAAELVAQGYALQPAAQQLRLLAQGYALQPAAQQLRLLAHVSRWLMAEGKDAAALNASAVEAFVIWRRAAGYSCHLMGASLRPLLVYLRGLGVVAPADVLAPDGPVEVALERYRRYLTVERGLKEITARVYLDAVRPFLVDRVEPDGLGLDLGSLGAADVTAFVVARCPAQPRGAAKQTVTALRSLLVWLHVEGEIGRPLAAAVPAVAGWRLAGLPRGLERGQVQRLLGSCDRATANGRRDFAIVTLLVRLGVRAGEVAALTLEDVDWRAGQITVRGKGDRSERLPLPADVGEAIAAYLQDGRPDRAQGRALFVRVKAPLGALSPTGISGVVLHAAQRAGLGEIRAHRLRHTAATEMLRAGGSLPEIGQLLRHRHVLTTAIYAKVDREALREIARPWPGARA
jgi:integrase/recombinase XerD